MTEKKMLDIFIQNDNEDIGLRLDETIKVLKDFRSRLPKELKSTQMGPDDMPYIQAILNVIDYLEVPHYVNNEETAEA
tara:strand:+ start:587 stop:820 length:234 start_codon:yes stop_codon:yes gene_type:complete